MNVKKCTTLQFFVGVKKENTEEKSSRRVDGQMKELAETFTVKFRVGALSVGMTWYSFAARLSSCCFSSTLFAPTPNLALPTQLSLFFAQQHWTH